MLALTFLDAPTARRPLIALLSEDARGARSVRTYEVDTRDKELVEGPWSLPAADAGACALAAVPSRVDGGGGCLVVGAASVTYAAPGDARATVPMKRSDVRSIALVDDDKWLLGDADGRLSLLAAARGTPGGVAGLRLEPLGTTSAPSALAYLDNRVVFVGSAGGDSQLVRLSTEPVGGEADNYVKLLETSPNLGPIVDMVAVDADKSGACMLVTASGVGKDGSLRIVRNGVGVAVQAAADLPGVTRVWGLRTASSGDADGALLLSFVGATRLLELDADDALGDAASAGALGTGAPTLAAASARGGRLLVATPASVRLLAPGTRALVAEWAPPAGERLLAAAATPACAMVATSARALVFLSVDPSGAALTVTSSTTTAADVSCLDITPLADDADAPPSLALVGAWDVRARVLALPSLQETADDALPGDAVPRSAALALLDGAPYALLALGDGRLLTWRVDAPSGGLSDRRAVALGSRAASLAPFGAGAKAAVLAACDRPAVVHAANGRLLVSNVNEGDVTAMARLNAAAFPDALALARPAGLSIGTVDAIQRLHVRAVPLGEQPRRLAHSPTTRTLAATIDGGGGDAVAPAPPDAVRLFDDATYETLDRVSLDVGEVACSITCVPSFDSGPEGREGPFYAVGTAYSHPGEAEPSRGRLLIYRVTESRTLDLVTERELSGAAYFVTPFRGGVLAGVNSRVALYKWAAADDGSPVLDLVASHGGHVLALYVAVRGDYVAVGDLMRSISLLAWRPESSTLESVARDYHTNWMTAVDALDDDTYIGAENSYNLFVARRNAGAASDEDRSRLDIVGEWHAGEFVNRFVHGSLVMRSPETGGGAADASAPASAPPAGRPRTLLFGAISGVVGVAASLTPPQFAFFDRLQTVLRRHVRGVGGFDHAAWRAFANERAAAVPARGFVDGDLVEQFLDLPPDVAAAVAADFGQGVTAEALAKAVDELSRVCH